MSKFPSHLFKNELLYEVTDGVAVITINAPQRMNTMSNAVNAGVMLALDMAEEDPNVAVVVFTGAGDRAFCAGGNLASEDEGAATGFLDKKGSEIPPTMASAIRKLRLGMTTSQSLREMDKPTIAAVNGACAGAGMAWACACDLRFASENAIFRTAFITAGLSGDYGGTWTLSRIVGSAKARELYLLNRKVSAAEAKQINLVSEVFPKGKCLEGVLKLAKEMAKFPPLALKRIKQNLNNADRLTSFSDALDGEAERHARTAMHSDAAEAGKAFMEKRTPNFKGVGTVEPWRLSKI